HQQRCQSGFEPPKPTQWRREDFVSVGISVWRQNDLEASHGCLFQFTRASYHSVRVQDLVSRAALPYATISAISDATVLGDSHLSVQLRHRPPPRLASVPHDLLHRKTLPLHGKPPLLRW